MVIVSWFERVNFRWIVTFSSTWVIMNLMDVTCHLDVWVVHCARISSVIAYRLVVDDNWLAWHVTVGTEGVAALATFLSACLFLSLLSSLHAIDDEHVDAEKDTASAYNWSDYNGNIGIASRVIATITVAIAITTARVGRFWGAWAWTSASLQTTQLSRKPVLLLFHLVVLQELCGIVEDIVVFSIMSWPLGVKGNCMVTSSSICEQLGEAKAGSCGNEAW